MLKTYNIKPFLYCKEIKKARFVVGIACVMLFASNFQVAASEAPETVNEPIELKQTPQKKTISGKIVDQNGQPVVGATIIEQGTTNGVITDNEGNFSFNINDAAKLDVSYIGYKTQEIAVGSRTRLDITLEEDLSIIEQVVVIGYGTQKKGNITGAVSTVSSDVIENRPITNLGAGLQGTVAGLNITSSNGAPGTGSSFNIRGTTNFSGSGPLVLVDGVEMDPNLINPNDVKEVTVLKDAASAAVYGARAAFGVILITTKTGYTNQDPTVSFSANYSINKPTVTVDYMNSLEYTQWMNDANTTTNGSNYFDDITMQHVRDYYNDPRNSSPVFHHPDDAANTYRYCGNTDWYKALNKNTYPIQQYNASIQGGSNNVKYFTSAGFFKQDGISRWADEDFKRFNIMQNISYKVSKHVEMGLKTTISLINQDTGPQNKWGSSSMGSTIPGDSRPLMPVYHPDGNFAGYCGDGYFTNLAAWQSQGGSAKMKKNDALTTGFIKIKPIEGLSVDLDYTYNYYNYSFKNHIRQYWDYDASGPAVIFPHTSPNGVSYSKQHSKYEAFNAYATYEKKFADKHYFKAMAGFNQEVKDLDGVGLSRNNLIVNDIPYLSLATGERGTSDYKQQWRIRGGLFRLDYIYDDRYIFQFAGRYDGSSRFPSNDRYEFFPSGSVGWRLSNEKFWQPIKHVVNEFKVYGNYGQLGNQNVSSYYPYVSTYGTGEVNYLFSGEKPMAVYAPGLVSENLTWETVTQWDVGVQFAMLDNRLTGEFDYFQRKTKDMLTKSRTLPAILGTGEPEANAANLKSYGWDLTLTWKHSLNNGLTYSASFILSDAQAKITKYDNPSKNLNDSYYVGKKMGEIWGFVTEGYFKTDAEAAAWDQSKVVGYKQLAGDLKFANIDGKAGVDYGDNTVSNPGDQKIIGNSTPRYNFGFRGTAEWKNIDFTIFFQGTMKRDIIANRAFYLNHYTSEWAVPQRMNYDYWREDNQNAKFPRARLNGSAVNINSTHFLHNAAYIRLKQLAIGYTIPEHISRKAGISKLRVYFNADNLWEHSKLPKTFDPELATANAYPFIRSYSFGINLTF